MLWRVLPVPMCSRAAMPAQVRLRKVAVSATAAAALLLLLVLCPLCAAVNLLEPPDAEASSWAAASRSGFRPNITRWKVRRHLNTPRCHGTSVGDEFEMVETLVLATTPEKLMEEARGRVVLVARHVEPFAAEPFTEYFPFLEWINACQKAGCAALIVQSHYEYSGRAAALITMGYPPCFFLLPVVEVSLPDGIWLYQELIHNQAQPIWVHLRSDDHNQVLEMMEKFVWYSLLHKVQLAFILFNFSTVILKLYQCVLHRSESWVNSDGIWTLLFLLLGLCLKLVSYVAKVLPSKMWNCLTFRVSVWISWEAFVLTTLASISLCFSVYRAYSRLNGVRMHAHSLSPLFMIVCFAVVIVVDAVCCSFPLFNRGVGSESRRVGERVDSLVTFVVGITFLYYVIRVRHILIEVAASIMLTERKHVTSIYRRVLVSSIALLCFSSYSVFVFDRMWKLTLALFMSKAAAQEIDFICFDFYLSLLHFCMIRAALIQPRKKVKGKLDACTLTPVTPSMNGVEVLSGDAVPVPHDEPGSSVRTATLLGRAHSVIDRFRCLGHSVH